MAVRIPIPRRKLSILKSKNTEGRRHEARPENPLPQPLPPGEGRYFGAQRFSSPSTGEDRWGWGEGIC